MCVYWAGTVNFSRKICLYVAWFHVQVPVFRVHAPECEVRVWGWLWVQVPRYFVCVSISIVHKYLSRMHMHERWCLCVCACACMCVKHIDMGADKVYTCRNRTSVSVNPQMWWFKAQTQGTDLELSVLLCAKSMYGLGLTASRCLRTFCSMVTVLYVTGLSLG